MNSFNINKVKAIATILIGVPYYLPAAEAAQLMTSKGTPVTTTRFAPNAALNKSALEYQEFLLDTNSKLLAQIKDRKNEVKKLASELAAAKAKIHSLELSLQQWGQHNKQEPGGTIASAPSQGFDAARRTDYEDVRTSAASAGGAVGSAAGWGAMSAAVSAAASTGSADPLRPATGTRRADSVVKAAPVHIAVKTEFSPAEYYLVKIQEQLSASLSDAPYGGYSGMSGRFSFDIAPDGVPQFASESVNSDSEFVRKIKYVIAKAAPFRPFSEPDTSNKLQLDLQGQSGESAPILKVSMQPKDKN